MRRRFERISSGIGGKVGANREREDKLGNCLVWAIIG